jgi:ferredoxin
LPIKINVKECLGCRICVSSCPLGLLETNSDYKLEVKEGCIECGACLNVCPYGFITERADKRIWN